MAVKDFWSELLTRESWRMLVAFAKEYDFVLIGGWAAYLWTKAHKSKDIDIVVDYATLKKLGEHFDVSKNQRLQKYEIKFDKFDVDVYLPFFSKLAIPAEDIAQYAAVVESIKTAKPEALLVLKQAAEIERRGSVKGKKDAIDILTLMVYADIDWREYKKLLEKYGHENFARELAHVITSFSVRDVAYLGLSFMEFKKWQRAALARIKKIF